MKKKIWLAVVLGLMLSLLALPAFAQEPGGDRACAGGSITVEPGTSVHNLAILGCTGVVKAGGAVTGSVAVLGGSLTIEKGSKVSQRVAVLGGSVVIDGEVGGDVAVAGGSVVLTDSAVVNGSLRIAGGSVQRSPGATVRGSVSQENNPRIPGVPAGPVLPRLPFIGSRTFSGGFDLLHGVFSALAFAALGAVLVALFPAPVRRISETAEHHFVPSVGVGCLTLIITPFVIVGLAITIIGIPVVLLLAIVGAVAWVVGWISIGALAGERILRAFNTRNITPVFAVIVGVLVIALIAEAPVVGGLVWLLVGLLGLGAVVLTRFGTRAYPPLAGGLSLSPAAYPPAPAGGYPPPPANPSDPASGPAASPVIVPSPASRPDEPPHSPPPGTVTF